VRRISLITERRDVALEDVVYASKVVIADQMHRSRHVEYDGYGYAWARDHARSDERGIADSTTTRRVQARFRNTTWRAVVRKAKRTSSW
jgi:hypothetical protein